MSIKPVVPNKVRVNFVSDEPLRAVREDHRFVNFWNSGSGTPEGMRTIPADVPVEIRKLAFTTMRQYRLTGAGHDVQWYSIKVHGRYAFHVKETDLIFSPDMKSVSVKDLFESLP